MCTSRDLPGSFRVMVKCRRSRYRAQHYGSKGDEIALSSLHPSRNSPFEWYVNRTSGMDRRNACATVARAINPQEHTSKR